MRRTATTLVTSVLMSLVLGASASACVAGWGTSSPTPCRSNPRQGCARKKPDTSTTASACRRILQSLPGRCGLRSFVQFQFVAFHKFEIHAPLRPAVDDVSAPLDSALIVSSIGSPETNRGPPRS